MQDSGKNAPFPLNKQEIQKNINRFKLDLILARKSQLTTLETAIIRNIEYLETLLDEDKDG
jgi:hypothetical protein